MKVILDEAQFGNMTQDAKLPEYDFYLNNPGGKKTKVPTCDFEEESKNGLEFITRRHGDTLVAVTKILANYYLREI